MKRLDTTLCWTRMRKIFRNVALVMLTIPLVLAVAFVYRGFVHDWTVYGFHYDEEAFRTIEPGDSIDALIQKVGAPLRMTFFLPYSWRYDGFQIYFDAKERAYLKEGGLSNEFLPLLAKDEVHDHYGAPYPKTWEYDGFLIHFSPMHGKAVVKEFLLPDGDTEKERLEYLQQDEVRQAYGDPISVVFPDGPSLQMWEYTQPGHLGRWADVTWDCRRVLVDIERYEVLEVHAHHVRAGTPIDRCSDLWKVLDEEADIQVSRE